MFWVITQIQNHVIWAFVDTGASKNLIQGSLFDKLSVKPEIFQRPGSMVVGNGEPLDVRGYCLLRFAVVDRVVYHEVGIVERLPYQFVLGAELMAAHKTQLSYGGAEKNEFRLRSPGCHRCTENYNSVKNTDQMQFSVKPAKLLPRDGYSDRLFPVCNMAVAGASPIEIRTVNAFVRIPRPLLTLERDIQSRMETLVRELGVPAMRLDGQIMSRFMALLKSHINVFQILSTDLGNTTTVTHKIKLVDGAEPVSARCRPVP